EMRWFPIADLPCHRHDTISQIKLNINPKAFFMVIPFIKDLRHWINQESGIYTSSNGDSDNTNEYIKQCEQENLHHQSSLRCQKIIYKNNTRKINIQEKLFGVDQQTSSFIRNGTYKQRKNSSKIIANLTPQTIDEQQISSTNIFQKQLSIQDTIQKHFSTILKNDSITVTDNTSITETILMRENNSTIINNISNTTQLTPPMSNDDENKRPLSVKNHKGKRSSCSLTTPFRILTRDQPDELYTQLKIPETNNNVNHISDKSQRHRRRTGRHLNNDITSHKLQEPFFNLTNDTFQFSGPRCWTQFRLNRSEVLGICMANTKEVCDSFPSIMIVAILSSFVIAIFIVGLAISYYHKQRKKQSNDSSYSITRYWRRQLASTSCDNLNSSLITNNKQSYPIVNETTSIIKNSFSWPEASMLHRQDQEQIKCSSTISSSGLSYSLTMEHITEPASLTFGLRWNDITKSLFVRVVSARDLFIYRRHRQPLVIDSDEIVGEVIFPIKFNILDSTEMTFTQNLTTLHKQLSNQELGQMLISLCYQPTDSSVTIIVLKAANLPRIGTTRLINPYFKIYMFYKNQRIFKKRSTIKRTTQTPVYNECFTFHIPNNDIENIYFDIILFDYDNHMKHEAIGTCSIGKEMNQHWNDVCHRQITKQIAHWYQLKSYNESIH
ncbi:unnamed protein product, partial [Rotaria sp. Silwood1]